MSDNAVQIQWDLESTVDSTLKIALNFLKIATSDNVQPFALLACEKFGNTLPICRATRKRIEQEIGARRDPIFLSITKAMIKQAGGETFEQLSSNVAGLNFLSLAAALMASSDLHEASSTIQQLIDRSARNKKLVPSEFHVYHILEVLEPRLSRLGFLEMCYTWDRWLFKFEPTRKLTSDSHLSTIGAENFLNAFRSLLRIGDEKTDKIVITSHSSTPWVLAFIEWCTGCPPHICDTAGSVILAQPEAPIILVLPSSPNESNGTEIELYSTSKTLLETFVVKSSQANDNKARTFHGMVTVAAHGQQTLHEFQASSDIGQKAMLQALCLSLKQCSQLLRPGEPFSPNPQRVQAIEQFYSGEVVTLSSSVPCLPEYFQAERVLKAAGAYLGKDEAELINLRELPLGTSTNFSGCEMARKKDDPYGFGDHFTRHIVARVSIVTANILALSLIDSELDEIRLHFDREFQKWPLRGPDADSVLHATQDILINGRPGLPAVEGVELHLKRLLGKYRRQNRVLAPIGCSFLVESWSGQVVLPQFVETMQLQRQPCLTIIVIPGILVRADQPDGPYYSAIVSEDSPNPVSSPYDIVPSDQVRNLSQFSALEYEWRLRVGDETLIANDRLALAEANTGLRERYENKSRAS
ncbi:MAG: hypothetical protein Q9227_006358 [Pyrenula ochraceoflavens]